MVRVLFSAAVLLAMGLDGALAVDGTGWMFGLGEHGLSSAYGAVSGFDGVGMHCHLPWPWACGGVDADQSTCCMLGTAALCMGKRRLMDDESHT